MEIKLLNSFNLVVPSVSGMEYFNENLYFISDNSNVVSKCNLKGELIEILGSDSLEYEIVAKKDKADFEAATLLSLNSEKYLLIIGSGSTLKNRNQAILFSLINKKQTSFDLLPFYEKCRSELNITQEDWNIEALAHFDSKLFFFNRGTNTIVEVNQNDFISFLSNPESTIFLRSMQLELGELDGISLGISGVTTDSSGNFYYTASAEDTSDWYNDGKIIGSAIGSFHFCQLAENLKLTPTPFKTNGKLIPTKLEAICKISENHFFVASDNDGKASELFELEIVYSKKFISFSRIKKAIMKSVSPNIFVQNIQETVQFYQILGFETQMTVPETDDPFFVLMTCGEVTFLFQSFESLGAELPEISRQNGGSLLLYIQIDKIRDFFEKIKNQVQIVKGLETTFYGATEFSILDNNGYLLTFAEDE